MRALLHGTVLAVVLLSGTVAAAPCSEAARSAGWQQPAASGHRDLDAVIEYLAKHRVIYVGEIHDRFEHHLTQLEVICRLHQRGPVSIGVEFFQAPAQKALDGYVMRHGDLQRLLRESEWFTRWGFDPRLYAPILRFARGQGIRLIALNVPGQLVSRVARGGMQALDTAERGRLPAVLERGPRGYVDRIRASFDEHPAMGMTFDDFLTAQLLWDEGMAQRGAEILLAHPRTTLVVLAGEGHVINADGIPDRLARRAPVSQVIVVQSDSPIDRKSEQHVRLLTPPVTLPPIGRLGVQLDASTGAAQITGFAEDSAARDAGLAAGDRLVAIDHRRLHGPADLRLALWDKLPGTPLAVTTSREDRLTNVILTLR
jgi:uncharacterized iron-regulated protein